MPRQLLAEGVFARALPKICTNTTVVMRLEDPEATLSYCLDVDDQVRLPACSFSDFTKAAAIKRISIKPKPIKANAAPIDGD